VLESTGGTGAPSIAAWGTIYGGVAAVAYTASNICLRSVTDFDPFWVSCVKTVPTMFATAPWLLLLRQRGERILPPTSVLVMLVGAALFGQLAGNVAFQWSLGVIGIALTVPICIGTVIIASAVLGQIYLNERITKMTVAALIALILAIWILTIGARTTGDLRPQAGGTTSWLVTFALAAACLAGVAFAVLGLAIRHTVMGRAGIAATTFCVATVGFVSLAPAAMARTGGAQLIETPYPEFLMMVLAGVFNMIAFLALARAMQITTLVNVNALNASQVAMASLAGVLFFHEQPSSALLLGIGLTIGGLLLMPRQSRISG